MEDNGYSEDMVKVGGSVENDCLFTRCRRFSGLSVRRLNQSGSGLIAEQRHAGVHRRSILKEGSRVRILEAEDAAGQLHRENNQTNVLLRLFV